MLRLKKVLVFSLLFLFTANLLAQEDLRIRGKVIDAASGRIIPFVTVQIKGVPLGSITEEDGKFAVKIPREYAADTLIFSSVGYEKLEYPISNLKEDIENLISLKEAVVQLAEVTVTRSKRLRPLKLLKEAISKIPQNFRTDQFTFDAYYRERIIENGATIKFADASTTFQQSGYTGIARKRRRSALTSFVTNSGGPGIRLGGFTSFFEFKPAGERLHDHFGLRSGRYDRVKVHDARASLNLSREKMNANVEGGPLSTLSKDLVRNLDLFLHRKRHKRYVYEAYESPDDEGKWHFVVKFKPKKAPADLLWIRAKRAKGKRISRLEILSGEVWIAEETMAISKISYSVQNDYRRHICNLQENEIKHYGYEVEANYQEVGSKWQLKDITRKDEFIFKDTIKDLTTPYATITELVVTNTDPELKEVKANENFLNIITNSLYDYPLGYNAEYWNAYEAEVPAARIDNEIRADMQAVNSLEEQFAMKHTRNDSLAAPVAAVRPTTQRVHGTTLTDDYAWLKDRKAPKKNDQVMDYLTKENEYAENYFIPMRRNERDLIDRLYRTMDTRAKTDPIKDNGYWYWSEYEEDNDYQTIYWRKDEPEAKPEVLWDLQSLADDKYYFSLSFFDVSPNNQYMAYAIDTTGNQLPMTYIKEMEGGNILPDSIPNLGHFVWTEDNQGFFYSVQDKRTYDPIEIKYHQLGSPVASDSSFMKATDVGETFNIYKSYSKEFIYLQRSIGQSTEYYMSRNKAPFAFRKLIEADEEVYYSFSHQQGQFYIMTNQGAPNWQLMKTDTANLAPENWQQVVAASDSVILEDYAVFDNYLVTLKKQKMKQRIEIRDLNTAELRTIKGTGLGNIYTLSLGRNTDPSADTLRYITSSPQRETHKVAYHLRTGKSRREKVNKAKRRGIGYSPFARTQLVWADARDGTKIPVSVVYTGYSRNGNRNQRPLFVEAYGAYGSSKNLIYSEATNILLGRGFVYAFVHVRGGGDLGDHWYKQGRMEHKMNSFTDLIDAIEYLTDNGFGAKDKVFASGGSAGGLLMGGVVNMRPDLFQGVFLDVPFVDVINTMLDDSLPLTVGEYNEWGNPKKRKEFKQMLAYSPYDNVKQQDYPRLAFYSGLNDKNVGYWEAAKMVAKLRANKTDDNILLLRTGMHAGHGPSSGRFASIAYLANKYAILFEWLEEVRREQAAEIKND